MRKEMKRFVSIILCVMFLLGSGFISDTGKVYAEETSNGETTLSENCTDISEPLLEMDETEAGVSTDPVKKNDIFEFKINITELNEEYTFPIKDVSGAYDIVVDWGDGRTSKISKYSDRSHTYELSGTYTIKVISFSQLPISFMNDINLIEIITPIPNIGADNFNRCFYNCTSLTTIPAGLFDNNDKVTDFESCFEDCSSLSTIPEGLFDKNVNVTDFEGCFSGCISLLEIPAGLFCENINVTDFSFCFFYCDNLTAIPSGLFDKNVNVTSYYYCFGCCSNLVIIPSGLFDKNVNAITFNNCFSSCYSLRLIPEGLLDKNVNIYSFEKCFYNCEKLIGLAPALWLSFPNSYGDRCFAGCTKLSNYTDIPSEWK